MKRILFLLAIAISFQCRGQITFVDTNTPWEQLSKQAKEEDKLIFIHFENSQCIQCNEVASQGFNQEMLKKIFDDDFISIRCNVASPNGQNLARKFQIRSSLMSLFVDPNGNILHVNNGSTSSALTYADAADLALSRKGKKQVGDFQKEYQAGERSPQFMREFMIKAREASMPIDNLMDEYVHNLPPDSLNNFRILKGIYELAPSIDSYAYKTIQKSVPPSLIDSIYNSSLPADRKAIRDGIIENSFRNAVQNRNEETAYRVAMYTRDGYEDNRKQGEIAFQKSMIRYYFAVRDTTHYFIQVQRLLDEKYMPLTIDSLNAMDDTAFKAQTNMPLMKPGKPAKGQAGKGQAAIAVKAFPFMPPSQFVHQELNEHAYHIYELTRNKVLLEKALVWSNKSMELVNVIAKKGYTPFKMGYPAYMDTYAHILYRLDRKDEAIEWQTKAVESQKAANMSATHLEFPLIKMKAGTL